MEISPADLGKGFAQEVIVRRANSLVNPVQAALFRSFFWRGTRLTYSTVDTILTKVTKPFTLRQMALFLPLQILMTALSIKISEYFHHGPPDSSPLPLVGISLTHFLFVFASAGICVSLGDTFGVHKQFSDPVTEHDAFKMREIFTTPHSAAMSYAYLVQEMARAQNISQAAQPALRDALRFIGEAVYTLSSVPAQEIPNHASYSKWAGQLRQAAEFESDPVIKAAHLREAESYKQAFVSANQSVRITRRNEALLRALNAQIEAVRVTLPTLTGSDANIAQVTELSENARNAAGEVTAQLNARAELDTDAILLNVRS